LSGEISGLAFDPSNRLCLVTYGHEVRFHRLEGATLNSTVVDANADPTGPTLAFDANGRPALVYEQDEDNLTSPLQLARFDGSAWMTTTIPGVTGTAPVLLFTPDGQPTVVFLVLTPGAEALRAARFDGTTWSVTTVDTGVINTTTTSAKVNSAGQPTVAYQKPGQSPSLATLAGSSWLVQSIPVSTDLSVSSLAYDVSGQALLAVLGPLTLNGPTLRLLRATPSGWNNSLVVEGASNVALAVNAAGLPSVAYRGDQLKLARFNGSDWLFAPLGPDQNSAPIFLNFDQNGRAALGQGQRVIRQTLP
jgi:hypothetical protein